MTAVLSLLFESDPGPSAADDQPGAPAQVATLRVIDDTAPPGLLESILGGVARAFGL